MCWLRNFRLCRELGLKWCQAVRSNRPCADEVFVGANCSAFSSFQGSVKVLEQSHRDFLPEQTFCPRKNKICSLKSKIFEDGRRGISSSTAHSACKSGRNSTFHQSFKPLSATRNDARKFAWYSCWCRDGSLQMGASKHVFNNYRGSQVSKKRGHCSVQWAFE